MRFNKNISLFIVCSLMISGGCLNAQEPKWLNASLVLSEIDSVEPFDPDQHPGRGYPGPTNLYTQNAALAVTRVFYDHKAKGLKKGLTFPHRSQGVQPRKDAKSLSILGFDRGTFSKNIAEHGTKVICVVIEAKDFGPPPPDPDYPIYEQYPIEQFMLCPKYSIFYVFFEPVIFETSVYKDLYEMHVEWAHAIKVGSQITDKKNLFTTLEEWAKGSNPLLGIHAIHLIARWFPDKIAKHYEEWILAPGLLPEVKLAIDQELCTKRGKNWGESEKREQWIAFLQSENPTTVEGTDLVNFFHRASGYWIKRN